MSGRTLVLVIVALVIAGVAAIIVKNRAQPAGQAGPKILVAASDVAAGAFVRADKDLAWVEWTQGEISSAFITSDVHKIEDFNGGVARRQILAGEPITTISIVRVNEGGFMSAVLSPGRRAVSIAVNSTSGNAGFIFPGDKVDLLLTHRIPLKDGSGDRLASETFIQDVRVLAIDQMLDNPDNKAVIAKTITIEVLPKQAEMVNVAQSLGTISVSLRSLSASPRPAKSSSDKPIAVTGAAKPAETPSPDVSHPPSSNYSTDDDVSKLMGDKNAVRSKVSVYHGSTNEQIDFHQGQK